MQQSETTYLSILGRILSSQRKQKGWDQATMSAKSGINRSSLSRLENGETALDAEQLTKIAKALDIRPAKIFEEADNAKEALEKAGIKVYMEKKSVKSGVGLSLALIGIAALGSLIATSLSEKKNKHDDD